MTTGYICRICGNPVYKTDLPERGYSFQCFYCDEDLFGFEVTEEEDNGLDVRADAVPGGGPARQRRRDSN